MRVRDVHDKLCDLLIITAATELKEWSIDKLHNHPQVCISILQVSQFPIKVTKFMGPSDYDF